MNWLTNKQISQINRYSDFILRLWWWVELWRFHSIKLKDEFTWLIGLFILCFTWFCWYWIRLYYESIWIDVDLFGLDSRWEWHDSRGTIQYFLNHWKLLDSDLHLTGMIQSQWVFRSPYLYFRRIKNASITEIPKRWRIHLENNDH